MTLKCVSPIDGSVFAVRETLSQDAAFGAVARAREAQGDWAARPLQERIGLVLAGAAAVTFTDFGTELGGKDPVYVLEDADLDAAVDTLIDRAMFNSGQYRCGIERIYVHESLYDAFVEKAVAIVNYYKLCDPLDPETTLGPMASVRFAQEVRDQISEAVAAGATARIAPFAEDDGGAYLTPQILTDVSHDMRVMRDESIGPVVGIMNRADYLDPALCWTGCKNAGRGGGLSEIWYHNLTRPKSYHLKKVTT